MNIKDRVDSFKYTWNHKKAFLDVEKLLCGKNTVSGYIHDIDKLILYFIFPDKVVQKIHRFISRHHVEFLARNGRLTSVKQLFIDCECARLTKPDKPMNGFSTIKKYYNELYMRGFNNIEILMYDLEMSKKEEEMDKLIEKYREILRRFK